LTADFNSDVFASPPFVAPFNYRCGSFSFVFAVAPPTPRCTDHHLPPRSRRTSRPRCSSSSGIRPLRRARRRRRLGSWPPAVTPHSGRTRRDTPKKRYATSTGGRKAVQKEGKKARPPTFTSWSGLVDHVRACLHLWFRSLCLLAFLLAPSQVSRARADHGRGPGRGTHKRRGHRQPCQPQCPLRRAPRAPTGKAQHLY